MKIAIEIRNQIIHLFEFIFKWIYKIVFNKKSVYFITLSQETKIKLQKLTASYDSDEKTVLDEFIAEAIEILYRNR